MEKYDYNILIALFDLFSRVKLFMSEDRDEIFNIALPDKKELLIRINKLINLGLIYCKDENNHKIQKKIITESDINTSLCLTIKGGELLEKRLNISWDEYIYEEVGYYAENIYEVTIQSNSLDKINKAKGSGNNYNSVLICYNPYLEGAIMARKPRIEIAGYYPYASG